MDYMVVGSRLSRFKVRDRWSVFGRRWRRWRRGRVVGCGWV